MKDRLQVRAIPAPFCLTLASMACCAQCRVLVFSVRKADAQACSNSSPSGGMRTGTACSETAKAYALCCSHRMMSDKAAADVCKLCPPDPNPLRGADDADDDSSSVNITSSSSDPDSSDTRASFSQLKSLYSIGYDTM